MENKGYIHVIKKEIAELKVGIYSIKSEGTMSNLNNATRELFYVVDAHCTFAVGTFREKIHERGINIFARASSKFAH